MAATESRVENPRSAHRARRAHPGITCALFISTILCAGQLQAGAAYPNYGFDQNWNTAFPEPSGFEGFQFDAPYHTLNPFTQGELEDIDEGRDLFEDEEFDGNGRTCATCHLAEANYNIAVEDFATLTPEEQGLVLGGDNAVLENEEAVKEKMLFNIHLGAGPGTEGNILAPLGPFRGSMTLGGFGFHTLNNHVCKDDNPGNDRTGPSPTQREDGESSPGGTRCDIGRRPPGPPLSNGAVDDGIRDIMLGWAGEGSLAEPFHSWDGSALQEEDCEGVIAEFAASNTSLRDLDLALATFALGAVKTHFTITQDRDPDDGDFRCPTREELLDMAIFQRWLGRRFELDITRVTFHDPQVQHGRNLFSTRLATCVACHVNAGGSDTQGRVKTFPVPFLTMEGKNDFFYNDDKDEPLFLIGTNKTSRNGSQTLEVDLQEQFETFDFPFDPGDHELRGGTIAPGFRQGGFNVQSIVDSVRNKQFFHQNGVTSTIDDAIEFYFTTNFHCPPVRYDFDVELEGDDCEVEVEGPEVWECQGVDDSQGGGAVGGDFRSELRSVTHTVITPSDQDCENPGEEVEVTREVEWEFSPSEVRAMLGGDEGVADMGLFLRVLASVYAIADCERYVDEMAYRISEDMPIATPLDHCGFNLADVNRILSEVSVPKSYKAVLNNVAKAQGLLGNFNNAPNEQSAMGKLQALRKLLASTRHMIATTPELP